MLESVRATFQSNGINIAYATVPKDYLISGQITNEWQHDYVPFSTLVKATSQDNRVLLYSSSRQLYDDFLNSMQRNLVLKSPGVIKACLRQYVEPEKFLTDLASNLVKNKVVPTGKTRLPSYYGNHLQEMAQRQLQFFYNHKIDINVQMELSSHYVDAILMRFETSIGGAKAYVITGMDFRGMEIYDALGMNLFGGLGSLFNRRQEPANNNIQAPFGHGKEYGKRVDVIEWGAERVYACIYMADKEKEALEAYTNFVTSFQRDQNLDNRFNQLIEQRYQQMYQQSMQLAGMARQAQVNAQMFAQQTARNISNQMSSISDGIMDSWDKKMASDSRISQNFSQAIRGVNTYTDASGKSFEFSNAADHVYTDQYGDHIGVSGTALDQETLNNLNWTKADKK